MELKTYFAQDTEGNVLPGAQVTVYSPAGQTVTLATLFDAAGASLSNPFDADDDGLIQFAAANGSYDVRIQSGVRDFTIPDLQLLDKSDLQASDIEYTPAGAGAVGTTVQDKLREYVSVKDFGAVGDGVADDTNAINSAINFLISSGGGTLFFPQGTYKTTSEILVNASKINLRGTGKRGVYPGIFAPTINTPSTIMPVHSNRNAIRFFSETVNAINAFTAHGINLATLETGAVPVAAFGWDCTGTGAFQRDFTFNECGIHGFTSPFDVYGVGTYTEMGLFKAVNCNINRNLWIARTLDGTQWNGFVFQNNEAGQNGFLAGQGGIAIAAHACSIDGNCMEGMRDPVKIFGAYRGVNIFGNYFEANVGRACVELDNARGPYKVGPNTYLAINDSVLDHRVLLKDCGLGECLDPYWSSIVHKNNLPLLGANFGSGDNVLKTGLSTSDYGFLRVDRLDTGNYSAEPIFSSIVKQRVTISARELDPISGLPMPVQRYSTSGSGAVGLSYTIAGSSGSYVVMSWLMKQSENTAPGNPYISFNVNGLGAAGSRDYNIGTWTEFWKAGEWCLITAAIKLEADMTSLFINLFPHGVNPAVGLVSSFLRPVVYVTGNINYVAPYVDQFTARSVTIDPSVGTWQQGDALLNATPTAGGQGEFLCVASGTPGTWVYS